VNTDFLRPECPWTSWEFGQVVTCEERFCSWIRQPLNTYSSVAYFLAALPLLWRYRREGRLSDLFYGISVSCIGLTSIFNHASQVRFFISLDFSSIFLWIIGLFVLALRRLGWIKSEPVSWGMFVGLVLSMGFIAYAYESVAIPLVALLGACAIAAEFGPHPGEKAASKKLMGLGLLLLALGGYFFYADAYGERGDGFFQCNPENHYYQLHTLWHVTTALGFFVLSYYHRQFYPARK
jgi:hypothetical protein